MEILFIFTLCTLLSLVGTRLAMALLSRSKIVDVPNERSNHVAPVLRGGGVAIVVVLLLGLITVQESVLERGIFEIIPLLVGVMLLSIISFYDDLRGASVKLRLLCQFIAVLCGMVTLIYTEGLVELSFSVVIALLVLGVSWVGFINLFNFMDGIDGITSTETLTITLSVALLSMAQLLPLEYTYYSIVIAGSVLGFLRFNWHPAKIFMGDVGSIVLGYVLGWLLIRLILDGHLLLALLLPLYYLFDSGITLVKRLVAGEKIWQAHSKHYYQQAVRSGKSHAEVVRAILCMNGWLFVYALTAIFLAQYGLIIMLVASLMTYRFLLKLGKGQ